MAPEKQHYRDINIKELLNSSIEKTKKALSYRSRVFLAENEIKFPPQNGIMWQLEYVKPDKFRVSQQAGKDFDEWITLGKEHFRGPGFPMTFGSNPFMAQDTKLTRSLLVDRYINSVKEVFPDSFGVHQLGDQLLYQLVYRGATAEKFRVGFFELDSNDRGAEEISLIQANIWIDLYSHYIVRIGLVLHEKSINESSQRKARFVLLFTSYNEDIIIVPPAFAVMKME